MEHPRIRVYKRAGLQARFLFPTYPKASRKLYNSQAREKSCGNEPGSIGSLPGLGISCNVSRAGLSRLVCRVETNTVEKDTPQMAAHVHGDKIHQPSTFDTY